MDTSSFLGAMGSTPGLWPRGRELPPAKKLTSEQEPPPSAGPHPTAGFPWGYWKGEEVLVTLQQCHSPLAGLKLFPTLLGRTGQLPAYTK